MAVPGLSHRIYLRTATSDISVFRQIFLDRQYDLPLRAPPRFIVDAGANIGLASVFFANRFSDARIIAIEPELSNFELLRLNAVPYRNISCVRAALWSEDAPLRIKDARVGKWAFETEPAGPETADSFPGLSVATLLESSEFPTIDLFKIDVEGAERFIFESGYEVWLSRVRDLVVETHDSLHGDSSATVHAALRRLGFRISPLGGDMLLAESE